jgi:AraC-like DNA-binding protein
MNYLQYQPHPVLRQHVRYFWSFESLHSSVNRLHIKSFADRYPRLIFQVSDNFVSICDTMGAKRPICYLSGIDSKNSESVMGGTFSHFGVSFYPHALSAFFQIDPHELIDEIPDLRMVCNSGIEQKLEQVKSHLERVQILTKYLYDKLCYSNHNDPLINHIIQHNEIHETANVYRISRKYNISERQLERKFWSSVGIAPKKLQRIARFEKSLKLLAKADYKQLGTIAHDLDYADQSHFIKDFRTFSGMTPYDFVKNHNLGSESSSFIYIPESESRVS